MNRSEKKIALNKQISDISDDLKNKASDYKSLGKDLLIIGGILVAGYTLSRILIDSDDSQEESVELKENTSSALGAALKGAATSVLLALAKQKLTEYLQNQNVENNEQAS